MSRTVSLRPWQRDALRIFTDQRQDNFLTVACPGAGKTTFALAAARQFLRGEVRPLVIVVPTAHLKTQWTEAALRFGLHVDPQWSAADGVPADMHGLVVTYAQVATSFRALAAYSRDGFVILDEIHHAASERTWGDAVENAFHRAEQRLLLSGTPFRSDDNPIPFVTYSMVDHGDALADYEYGYGEAIVDGGVVRPVFFPRFDGHMEWMGADGALREAGFDDELRKDEWNARLRTALSPDGDWLSTVLGHAHERLGEIRRKHPNAGGLVIALDHEHAREIATLLERRFGVNVRIALSDDPRASDVIARFAESDEPWIVAVRMISEGVDIPRLRVGVYATTTTTAMFFRQAVGRIARWTPGLRSQRAYMYLPDDVRLRYLASTVAEQRRHSIAKRPARAETEGFDEVPGDPAEQMSLFTALSSTVLEVDGPDEPDDGLDPDEDLLATPDDLIGYPVDLPPAPPLPGRSDAAVAADAIAGTVLRTRKAEKKSLRDRNADRARSIVRLSGLSHAQVNAELNRLSSIKRITDATVDDLTRRLVAADAWLERL